MTPYNSMSDAELAKRVAEAMGWRVHKWNTANFEHPNGSQTSISEWSPCKDYNDCRVFEDWLWSHGPWGAFEEKMKMTRDHILRSTARQRVIAGLQAIEDGKKSTGSLDQE